MSLDGNEDLLLLYKMKLDFARHQISQVLPGKKHNSLKWDYFWLLESTNAEWAGIVFRLLSVSVSQCKVHSHCQTGSGNACGSISSGFVLTAVTCAQVESSLRPFNAKLGLSNILSSVLSDVLGLPLWILTTWRELKGRSDRWPPQLRPQKDRDSSSNL